MTEEPTEPAEEHVLPIKEVAGDNNAARAILGAIMVKFAGSPDVTIGVITNLHKFGICGEKLVVAYTDCVGDIDDPKVKFNGENVSRFVMRAYDRPESLRR